MAKLPNKQSEILYEQGLQPDIEEAVAPRSSLRSRFLGRRAVKAYFKHSGHGHKAGKQGLLSFQEDEKAILQNPIARDIITNDGRSTFLVHGTNEQTAKSIVEHGLGVTANYHSPDKPDLKWTTKMLARHNEPGSVARNTHGLAYRFDASDSGESSKYKVVAELPIPNPGTSLRIDQFAGTPFEQPDGISIVAHGDDKTAHGKPYSIPPERIRGYFNVENGEFTPNERFVAIASDVGAVAVEGSNQ